ncbi:MAG: hypothetical protein Q4E61_04320, partial [Alphaproteobacteria bacterium]|nr:hypothetical protein [Alphaproteobacteria bacterium]
INANKECKFEITQDLSVAEAIDCAKFTIKNTGDYSIFLGDWNDVEEKGVRAYRIMAGNTLNQKYTAGCFYIPNTEVKPGEIKTISCSTFYTSNLFNVYYKRFQLTAASNFDFVVYYYDNNGTQKSIKRSVEM